MTRTRRRALTMAASAGLIAGAGLMATTGGAVANTPAAGTHPGYTVVGAVPASTTVGVDVSIPLRHQRALDALLREQADPHSSHYRQWLSPAQFQHRYGVSDAQLATVRRGLAGSHVTVTRAGAQAVRVSGTSTDMAHLFATTLERVRSAGGPVRTAATSVLTAPRAISAVGGTPIDLSAQPRMHSFATKPANRYGQYGTLWFDDLKQAYKYPAYGDNAANGKVAGKGQTIGLLMANAPKKSDVKMYFAHENAATPSFTVENVLGGAPFDPNGASFESDLDVEQSGGIAPNADIVYYSIPDLSDESVFAGYTQIVEDNKVDEVSSSFGGCELYYTAAYNNGTDQTGVLTAYDDLFKQGNAQGITFVASSGDSGALGCTNAGYLHGQTSGNKFIPGVEWPADDPHVTGVGGTNLSTSYTANSLTSTYLSENAGSDTEVAYDPYGEGTNVSGGVWGSGGGTSAIFTEPSWQKNHTGNTTGYRTVPDVALQMGGCPGGISKHCNPTDTADAEAFDGQFYGAIGTSAGSPDFAGTMALYNEAHGVQRSGNINPVLYQTGGAQRAGTLGYQVFHERIPGDNGYYQTAWTSSGGVAGGFDEVLGNGTLKAKNFVFGRNDTPAAGDPQTASNP